MNPPLQDLHDFFVAENVIIKDGLKDRFETWVLDNRPEDYDELMAFYINNIEFQNNKFLSNQVTSFLIQNSELLGIPM